MRKYLVENISDETFLRYSKLENASDRALNLVFLLNNRPDLLVEDKTLDGKEILAKNIAFIILGKKLDKENSVGILSDLGEKAKGPVASAVKEMTKQSVDRCVLERAQKQVDKIRVSTIDIFNGFLKDLLKKHKKSGVLMALVDLCEGVERKLTEVLKKDSEGWQLALDYLRNAIRAKLRNGKLSVHVTEKIWRDERRTTELGQIIAEMKNWASSNVHPEEALLASESDCEIIDEVPVKEKEKDVGSTPISGHTRGKLLMLKSKLADEAHEGQF